MRPLRNILFALVAACPRQTEVKPTPQEEEPPPAPTPKPTPPPKPAPKPPKVAQPAPEPPPVVIVEDGIRLEYRAHAGRTVVEVTEPEGAQVQAFDGSALVADDTVPLAFDAQPDHYYRLVARFPSGAVREDERTLPADVRGRACGIVGRGGDGGIRVGGRRVGS